VKIQWSIFGQRDASRCVVLRMFQEHPVDGYGVSSSTVGQPTHLPENIPKRPIDLYFLCKHKMQPKIHVTVPNTCRHAVPFTVSCNSVRHRTLHVLWLTYIVSIAAQKWLRGGGGVAPPPVCWGHQKWAYIWHSCYAVCRIFMKIWKGVSRKVVE